MTNLNISIPQEFHTTGEHKFPKIHKPPSNYGCQKSNMKFHTENPQFRSDLWTSQLFGAFCPLHVNSYISICKEKLQ